MSEEQDLQSSSPSEVDSSDDEESKAGTSVAVNPFFDKNKRTKLERRLHCKLNLVLMLMLLK